MKRVGIERARGLVAAVGTDAENVYAVLTARVMRPDLFIVSRAETEDAKVKLRRAGADRVISPYQIGAVQIAQTAIRPAVVDFFELATSTDNLELAIEESNESFRASKLGHVKLRLVHAYQTDYVEEGAHFDHLWRFADADDGYMEEIHALRDK